MAGAAWVRWVFAAMYVALSLFYLVRFLASARSTLTNRSVDAARCLMSLGMVAMLVPWIDPLPRPYWQVLFGVAAGHIALRLVRRSVRGAPVPAPDGHGHHELHLMIGSLAMVYTLALSSAGSPGMGSTSTGLPVLAWAFIAYFLMFAVWLTARLAVPGDTLAPVPHLLGSSEIAMAIGMSYMLMTMR